MRVLYLASFFLLMYSVSICQYTDYIGAGHSEGIIVTSSSNEQRPSWNQVASGDKTLNGSGLEGRLAEAARLLSQASFGFSEADLQSAAQIDVNTWIDDQIALPSPDYVKNAWDNVNYLSSYYLSNGIDSADISFFPGWTHWRYGLWQEIMFGKAQLRQRMTFALSEILVISDETVGGGDALSEYYNILSRNAFGNFRDLLHQVTLNPSMGYYLSHLNNPREIPEENIRPDQNYAREIMQLFTIGLVELNMDGTPKLDANGNQIPTYNNEDIAEMSKIFTGLSIGAVYPNMGDLYFGRGIYGADMTKPMTMFEEWHQQGEKKLLNGTIIPDGQSGMKDIEDAIDMLFHHANTPPFICKQLIQRFVTSNPSPAYVQRVANVFVNDGTGVRGNLAAVVKAILLDEEARSCDYVKNANSGKMYEPIIRYAHFVKAMGIVLEGDMYFNHAYSFGMQILQHPLSSPSVFNFFKPNHQPIGDISEADLVAPEFQILNSLTVLDNANLSFSATYYQYQTNHWEDIPDIDDPFDVYNDMVHFVIPAQNTETLINKIDLLYTNGNMSESTRSVIKKTINQMGLGLDSTVEKIKMAIYLTLISPDYVIHK